MTKPLGWVDAPRDQRIDRDRWQWQNLAAANSDTANVKMFGARSMVADDETIFARFAFRLPDFYRAVRAAGLLDKETPHGLPLTDLWWLTPDIITNYETPPFQIKEIIPFAWTARRDLYCWYPSSAKDDDIPVIFCPRDGETAFF
jgi:hypothetical protein